MNELLKRLDPAQVWQVVSDPTSNLVGATILMAMSILVVMIVLVALTALLGTSPPPRPVVTGPAMTPEERRRRNRRRFLVWLAGALAAVAVLSAVATVALTDDRVCLRCHARTVVDQQTAKRKGPHPGVKCADCHARAGLAGRVTLAAGSARSYARSVLGEGGDKGHAFSDACLGCHRDVLDGPRTVSRVRVDHTHIVEARFRCVDCHSATGHGPTAGTPNRPQMSLCVTCHDGTKASAECETCHVGDITGTRSPSIDQYPQITLGRVRTCRGCHPVDACNACHGLELPHSEDFARGEVHGRQAAFSRKKVCARCHEYGYCRTRCHPHAAHPSESHAKDWNRAHAASSGPRAQAQCRSCHKYADFRCNMCHSGYPAPAARP